MKKQTRFNPVLLPNTFGNNEGDRFYTTLTLSNGTPFAILNEEQDDGRVRVIAIALADADGCEEVEAWCETLNREVRFASTFGKRGCAK